MSKDIMATKIPRPVVALVLIAIIVGLLLLQKGSESPARSPAHDPPPYVVDYTIVDQWSIPNGGWGKVIVIDSVHANERDLRALGDELRFDTQAERNALIFVYSHKRAALIRQIVLRDRASSKDLRFYDAHFVGSYTRNINTGIHEFVLTPNGLNGRQIEITY
jgi:hypothetical protein